MNSSATGDDALTGDLTSPPPGEHESELVDGDSDTSATASQQAENAESSQDQPSQ